MDRVKKFLYSVMSGGFGIFYLMVLLLVIFASPSVMKSMQFSNNNLLLSIIGILFSIMFIYFFRKNKWHFSAKGVILVFSILLLCFHLILIFNILFKTGWDAGTVMDAAYNNIYNKTADMDYFNRDYFSIYPNNVVLLFYEMLVCFVVKIFSGNYFTYNLVLVFINSLIFIVTGILLYLILNKKLKNNILSVLGLVIYTILVGTSSWVLIPYSDSLSLIFVMLIIYVYMFFNKNHLIKYFLIGLLSFIGFQLKPQVFILFIAITIIKLIDLLTKKKIGEVFKYIGVIFISGSIVMVPLFFIKDNMKLDKEKAFGITHFLMMGLNYERSGVFLQDDVDFSSSFPTRDIRTKKNIEVIKARLTDYSGSKLLDHLKNKVLVNYNDSTFAFGEEGNFYSYEYENKLRSARFLKNLFYTNGDYYNEVSIIRQWVWILVLLLLVLGFDNKKEEDILVLKLSLLGLLLYLMLFEARARYLFIYVPIFIIIAIKNLDSIFEKCKKRLDN